MRILTLIAAATMLAAPAPLVAQETGAACAAIADDAERLACYDAIYRTPGDDTGGAEVRIESEQLIPARPVGRAPAQLVIACIDGALDVRFTFANQQLSNTSDNAPLTFQVDSGGNTVRNLPVSDDNVTAGFATARDATAFLDTLESARNLKVRITPVRQRSLTVDFRLTEFAEAIGTVRGTCG